MTPAALVKRFLARVLESRSDRLYVRCAPEERAAYDMAATLADSPDASSWARQVLSREARKLLRAQ